MRRIHARAHAPTSNKKIPPPTAATAKVPRGVVKKNSICYRYQLLPAGPPTTMLASRSTVAAAVRAKAALPCASAAAPYGARLMSSSSPEAKAKNLVTSVEGVHQTMKVSKAWRSKPLFRRQGDVRFKTGLEAANLLVAEAKRRDAHETHFIQSVESTMACLSPIFERNPRYAFVAKQLMEPERFIQFRVAWIDDVGSPRMNRGYRIQYSSSIGPYEGAIHLGHHVNSDVIKAFGFDSVFANAVTGFDVGAAVGGSDVNPYDKSEAEIQRFCQSYMTELAKYVGPDLDQPTMGMGVGEKELGYMFGQYKRINIKSSSGGNPFLSARNVKVCVPLCVFSFSRSVGRSCLIHIPHNYYFLFNRQYK